MSCIDLINNVFSTQFVQLVECLAQVHAYQELIITYNYCYGIF